MNSFPNSIWLCWCNIFSGVEKRVVAMWFLANCIMHMPLETSTKKEHLNNKIVYKYRLLLTSCTCGWKDVWQSSAKYMLPLLKKHFGKDLGVISECYKLSVFEVFCKTIGFTTTFTKAYTRQPIKPTYQKQHWFTDWRKTTISIYILQRLIIYKLSICVLIK